MSPHFTVHKLNAAGMEKATALADTFSAALEQIESLCGGENNSLEVQICRIKMQEACFFAKRAVAVQTENQQS